MASQFPEFFEESNTVGVYIPAFDGQRLLISGLVGLAGTVPLIVAAQLGMRSQAKLARKLRSTVERVLFPLLGDLKSPQVVAIAAAAGWGEELLFRGLVQQGVLETGGDQAVAIVFALLVSSVAFGVCHWVHLEYAIAAGVAGFYFGMLAWGTGSLLVPMIVHCLYDIYAISQVRRWGREMDQRDAKEETEARQA